MSAGWLTSSRRQEVEDTHVQLVKRPEPKLRPERDPSESGVCPWCDEHVANLPVHVAESCPHPYLQWYFQRVTPELKKKVQRVWDGGWEAFRWPTDTRARPRSILALLPLR